MDENPRESEYNFKSPQLESLESHTDGGGRWRRTPGGVTGELSETTPLHPRERARTDVESDAIGSAGGLAFS